MVLQQMQTLLARLYDAPGELAVMDFLMTDAAHLRTLVPNEACTATNDERVLLSEDDDGLRIGVYIAPEVLDRLAADNPLDSLSETNLHDFCTALEGVSHFHYLTCRASHTREVSLLELELQAEVDKYAAALRLLTAQTAGRFPRTLHERLFHFVRFDADLGRQDMHRYETANRFAAKFCRKLDERFLTGCRARPEQWLRELRRFYRLSHTQKLRAAIA